MRAKERSTTHTRCTRNTVTLAAHAHQYVLAKFIVMLHKCTHIPLKIIVHRMYHIRHIHMIGDVYWERMSLLGQL